MEGRASSSARAVQKKLRKIVKDVMKMSEMDGVVDGSIDPIPAMDIFLDEDGIDKYGEDLHEFKADAEKCCKFISKMRGKRADGPVILAQINALLEKEFPDVFPPAMEVEEEATVNNKKRGRPSTDSTSAESPDRQPKKKSAKHAVEEEEPEAEGLSTAEKSALKAIINKLSKAPEAEYFLYPVDQEAYPDYYALIAQPMDLATAKQKLNEYTSVEEALQDLRLIWENCRTFNAEGSDILLSAEACAEMLEALVEEKLGEQYVQKKKGKSKSRKSTATVVDIKAEPTSTPAPAAEVKTPKQKRKRGPSNQVDQPDWPIRPRTLWTLPEGLQLPRAALKELVRLVSGSDYSEPFLKAVDPEEAPGYLELIATPMDLGTLKKRVNSGMYDSDTASFVTDMRLIWENCVRYNDPSSDIAAFAANLGEEFEEHLGNELSVHAQAVDEPETTSAAKGKGRKAREEMVEDEPAAAEAQQESAKKAKSKPKAPPTEEQDIAEGGEGEAKKPLSVNMKKMKKILKEMYKDDRSLPFREPVPVDEVPGYAELIPNPMDLSTVKANLSKYDETPGKFLRDMRLIFDNCQKFNMEDSDIHRNAGALRDLVDQLYNEAFPPIDHAAEAAMKLKIAAKAARKASISDDPRHQEDGGSGAETTIKVPKAVVAAAAAASASSGTSAAAANEAAAALAILPPAKVTARMQSLPSTVEGLTALAGDLQDQPLEVVAKNQFVRERAFHRAHERLRTTRVPYVAAPELYTVQSWGSINPDAATHTESSIYPMSYTCSRTLRLCVAPATPQPFAGTSEEQKALPWVPVEVKSQVILGDSAENPVKFMVSLENGTVIATAADPKEAWLAIAGKEEKVLRTLGSKLKRCRAVFNRLAVSPDALPFLEMVPLSGPVGQSYYSIITAPMWFREVHSRLVEGAYDCEFDFAWDMRLIFKNCMEYNMKGSELYEAAERLTDAFEHLFTAWVLNIQDRSVDDLAKGAWDAWESLRFFDLADPTENVCAVTGTRGAASQFLQCRCCEDQNLASLHPPVQSKNLWVCRRCQDALDMAGGDLTANPFQSVAYRGKELYSREEFDGYHYVPAPEIGVGWNKARRNKNKAAPKTDYLSPLGYEVPGKEDIQNQIAYEDIVNENLYKARAAEFQEYVKSNRPRAEGKKSARHRRATTTAADPLSPEKGVDESKTNTTSAPAIDPLAAQEEGRIATGKLYGFQAPAGQRLAWFVCADEAAALQKAAAGQDISDLLADRVEMTEDHLPASGFFGFEIAAIRARIEGLEGVLKWCPNYQFTDTVKVADAILEDVLTSKRRLELLHSSEEALRNVLNKERWRMAKQMSMPPRPRDLEPSDPMVHKVGFCPLFPQAYTTEQGDTLLALWEFMCYCPTLQVTIDAYSLHDLICSLAPPSTPLTSYGQVVFDEVCCNLVGVMFSEIRARSDYKEDVAWQHEVLMLRPMNNITWPALALEALRILAFPLSLKEIRQQFTMYTLPAHILKQRDLFMLLINHPVIDTFLINLPVPEGHEGQDLNKITRELRALKEHFSSTTAMMDEQHKQEDSPFASVESFAVKMRAMFVELLASPNVSEQRVLHAHCILRYLEEIYSRWEVSVPAVEVSDTYPVPSVAEMNERLQQEDQNQWRFWGGYGLSNADIPGEQVVTPATFIPEGESDYAARLRTLRQMEVSLLALRSREPDNYSTVERTAIYATLLDICSVAREFILPAKERQNVINAHFKGYSELPNAADNVPAFEVVKNTPPGTRCHFTGILVDHTMDVVWVAVPPAYQDAGGKVPPPPVTDNVITSGGRSSRNSVYTGPVELKTAMVKVHCARETALREARHREERIINELQPQLYSDPKDAKATPYRNYGPAGDPQKTLRLPTEPLGHDRKGNTYWMLSVQQVSTLFPYQPNGSPLALGTAGMTGKTSIEPCLLVREVSGWWGYHNTAELPTLLGSFSSENIFERVLILRIIEQFVHTRVQLYRTVLNVRSMQRDWINRRVRTEQWAQSIKMPPDELTPMQQNRLQELVWARCVEVRNQLHASSLYRLEDDPPFTTIRAEKENLLRKRKKYSDVLTAESFEFSAHKGFYRQDALQRLRQTNCTTTACKILADAAIVPDLQKLLQSCPFLIRNERPSLADGQAAGAGGDDEDGDGPARAPVAAPVVVVPPLAAAVSSAASRPGLDIVPVPAVMVAAPVPSEQRETVPMDVAAEESKAETTPPSEPMEEAEPAAPEAAASAPAEPAAADKDGDAAPMDDKEADDHRGSPAATEADAGANAKSRKAETTDDGKPNRAQDPVPDGPIPFAGKAASEIPTDPENPLPDLLAVIKATTNGSYEFKSKPIELRHLITNKLLRIFPSGKDASNYFKVAQPNISLALHGNRTDYLGFKWQIYAGPLIDWAYLEPLLPSMDVLLAQQVLKHQRENYDLEEEKKRVFAIVEAERRVKPERYIVPESIRRQVAHYTANPTARIKESEAPRPPPVTGVRTIPQPPIPGVAMVEQNAPAGGKPNAVPLPPTAVPIIPGQPVPAYLRGTGGYLPPMQSQPIHTSTALVSARMLKLKAELLNLFYIMPEKALRLPDLDEEGERAIAEAGTCAAQAIRDGLAKISGAKEEQEGQGASAKPPAADVDTSQSNVDRLADKAARKAKRRLRRKLSTERYLKGVQEAETPLQLLQLICDLENALPPILLFKYDRAQLPVRADTLAAAAVRLYALDRVIAYDEIKGVENNFVQCPYRLRHQFYPRCVIASSCNRFFGHNGKCNAMVDTGFFRTPEFQDIAVFARMGAPVQPYMYNPAMANAGMRPPTQGNNLPYNQQARILEAQRRQQYMQQMAALKPRDEDTPLEEVLRKLLTVRKELDIETIVPYMPVKDITAQDWV